MRRDLVAAVLSVASACCVLNCAAAPKPASPRTEGDGGPMVMMVGGARIDIEKPAMAFPKSSGRFNGWLGYALERRIWIDSKFRERFKDEQTYRYTYEEELEAREGASKMWSELAEKDHYDDPYFRDLREVEKAAFFREYVWHCVPHPEWAEPNGLRSAAFSAWLSANLPSHVVETWVSAQPAPYGQRVVIGVEAHRRVPCRVEVKEGR